MGRQTTRAVHVRLNEKELELLELLRDGKVHYINCYNGFYNTLSKFEILGILLYEEGHNGYCIFKDNPTIDRLNNSVTINKELL